MLFVIMQGKNHFKKLKVFSYTSLFTDLPDLFEVVNKIKNGIGNRTKNELLKQMDFYIILLFQLL